MTIYTFNADSKKTDWFTLDDVVMGGQSVGSFTIHPEGYGVFKGKVSLENNGGFSSVRHQFSTKNTTNFSYFRIVLRGDGKPYQFRVKSDKNNQYSYAATFNTQTKWETIDIPYASLLPVFRGRKLNMPHFNGVALSEIGFLIGNKKAQEFQLEIKSIQLIN
ncbi:CIA30 family protein [Bizionia sediminis]|uniref:CIA30 family protein n=1 Tax=Bizionia sediminis TaxID=1737064 RepID=A0ABW5KY73_9FLAO